MIGQKRDLGPVQADAFGPVAFGEHGVAQQSNVGAKADPDSIARFGRQIAHVFEVAGKCLVLSVEPPVLAHDLAARVEIHHPGVAIDDQRIGLLDELGVRHANDSRNLERLGQDRRVRGRPPLARTTPLSRVWSTRHRSESVTSSATRMKLSPCGPSRSSRPNRWRNTRWPMSRKSVVRSWRCASPTRLSVSIYSSTTF